jgi:hypothetical protein
LPITQKEQVMDRRNRVWQLYSQGKSQRAIVRDIKNTDGIEISQKTVCNDLIALRKESDNFVTDNRKRIREEYAKVMSNLEQLKENAWNQFNAIDDKNSSVKTAFYDTILKINHSILTLLSVGDVIEMETKLSQTNENMKEIKQEMMMREEEEGGEISSNNNEQRYRSQAKF